MTKLTHGVSRNASVRRSQRMRASGTRSPRGRKKTASGPRTATSVSAMPEVGDEHVLEHVHGLQVLLADGVDRADEREDGDRHAGAEDDGSAPRRQLGATPPP